MTYLWWLILLVLIYSTFETWMLEIRRVAFSRSAKGLKIVQLSDIHIGMLGVSSKAVSRVLDAESPDLVVMTGDYIERPEQIEKFLKFLTAIKGRHRVLITLGNHDYKAFIKNPGGVADFVKSIEASGAEVLENRSVTIEKNSKLYNIAGISDMRYGHADITKALEGCSKDAFSTIALSHNPDIVLEIPSGKVDYLFCGHFHGGQIWAPFDLEFRLLRREKLCRMGVKRGLHKMNGINLYINRGLGNVCIPLRFMSRPEITVFQLP